MIFTHAWVRGGNWRRHLEIVLRRQSCVGKIVGELNYKDKRKIMSALQLGCSI